MKRRRVSLWKRRLVLVAVIVAFLLAIFSAGALWNHLRAGSRTKITNELLSQQLVSISELATIEYHYTNMGRFENQTDFYGWKVPLTRKSFIVSYDGIIKAGINAADIQTDVTRKKIRIILPEAKILSHEMKDDSIEILDETKNIFNQLEIQDYTGFAADQKEGIEKRAIENGFLQEASTRAADAVKGFVAKMPGVEDKYEVEVEFVAQGKTNSAEKENADMAKTTTPTDGKDAATPSDADTSKSGTENTEDSDAAE